MTFDVCTFDLTRTATDIEQTEGVLTCWPAPMALVRTSIARMFEFKSTNHGEDRDFAEWIRISKIRDEYNRWTPRFKVVHLPRVLYHAHFRHKKPEFGGAYYNAQGQGVGVRVRAAVGARAGALGW